MGLKEDLIPEKTCAVCKESKKLLEFGANPMSADGHGYLCHDCHCIESMYRNMKSKHGHNYKKQYERHKMLARRYARLRAGMTPRVAARDEVKERKEADEARRAKRRS